MSMEVNLAARNMKTPIYHVRQTAGGYLRLILNYPGVTVP